MDIHTHTVFLLNICQKHGPCPRPHRRGAAWRDPRVSVRSLRLMTRYAGAPGAIVAKRNRDQAARPTAREPGGGVPVTGTRRRDARTAKHGGGRRPAMPGPRATARGLVAKRNRDQAARCPDHGPRCPDHGPGLAGSFWKGRERGARPCLPGQKKAPRMAGLSVARGPASGAWALAERLGFRPRIGKAWRRLSHAAK